MFYGAAAVGWAIYAVTPNIVSATIAMTAGRQIAALRAKERELVQTWGPDVEANFEPAGGGADQAPAGVPAAAPGLAGMSM